MITEKTLKFIAGLDMSGNKEAISFKVTDEIGERTLIIPPGEVTFSGDPTPGILKIEALTRTRLRDGENPLWFIRVHWQFQKESNPNDKVSFAEFVQRLHPNKIEVVGSPGISGKIEHKQTEEGGEKQPFITLLVAVKEYTVSRSTLKRAITKGHLESHRPPNAPKNAPHRVSRAAIEAIWPKRH